MTQDNTPSIKRWANIAVAVFVAALMASSIQACVARRDDFRTYPSRQGTPAIPGEIRVLLASGGNTRISVDGGYVITAGSRKLFSNNDALPEIMATASGRGILLGRETLKYSEIEIKPLVDGTLAVNDSLYHGRLRLVNHARNGLMAINVLPVEDYLRGVIACEMPSYWPPPALRAQAIAARSYALYRARQRASWDYDVAATTGDQVYRGIAAQTPSTDRAANDTHGVVLLYEWQILPAFFHSVCGGRTASRRTIFGEPDITPLSGVDCVFCHPERHGVEANNVANHYRWEFRISEKDLLAALAANEIELSGIVSISPVSQDFGGHFGEVVIAPRQGPGKRLTVNQLRTILGHGKLKGSSFVCVKQGSDLVFSGRGFGHGVGMCQWGARGMANAGYTSNAILEHYYPGAELVKLY